MKKIKFFIFLILLFLIILFIININFLQFIKIYYIQLIIILVLFFIFIIIFKFKIFLSFLLIFIISLLYFYIYPNFIQKNLINYSEIFFVNEKNELKEINLDISLGSGNLKIESNQDKENLIFDYNSKYKIFKSSKTKSNVLNYEIFENPVFKRIDLSGSEWNLKINENILTNLNIKANSINGILNLKNLKLGKLNFAGNSSRVEIYLSKKEGNSFLNLKFKPSIIDIYLPQNFYIELDLKLVQSITNISEIGFKDKENNIFYYDNGEKGKIYIKLSGNNLNIKFHFLQD